MNDTGFSPPSDCCPCRCRARNDPKALSLRAKAACGHRTGSPVRQRTWSAVFSPSPMDALIGRVVWRRLCRQIPIRTPIRLDLAALSAARTTALPQRRQRRPARRGDVWGFRICPDVIEYSPDISTVRDEGDDAHLPTRHTAGKKAGTPRRCWRSARPTDSAQRVWAAPAREGAQPH